MSMSAGPTRGRETQRKRREATQKATYACRRGQVEAKELVTMVKANLLLKAKWVCKSPDHVLVRGRRALCTDFSES